MKRIPLTAAHREKLAAFGLHDLPSSACTCLRFAPGEMVSQEGHPLPWLALVVEGRAKVCRTASNGKSLILCYYVSDGLIGGIELMTQHEEAIASVIALSDFECIAIPYHICQRERQTNLVFMDKLAALLAQNLADSSADYAAASLNSGEQRLCSYILRASYQDVFRDVLTDVACSIGMSYRHMFRLLGQLCTDGILEKRKEGYYIAQPKALSAKAKNEC